MVAFLSPPNTRILGILASSGIRQSFLRLFSKDQMWMDEIVLF